MVAAGKRVVVTGWLRDPGLVASTPTEVETGAPELSISRSDAPLEALRSLPVRLTGRLVDGRLSVESAVHDERPDAWDAQQGGEGVDLEVANAVALEAPAADQLVSIGVSPADDGHVVVVQLSHPVPAVEEWAAAQGPTKVRVFVFVRDLLDEH